jgi:molecular chaperone GrpE
MSSRGKKSEESALKRPAKDPEPDESQGDDAIEILEVVGVDEATGIAPAEAGEPEQKPSPAAIEPPLPGETTALEEAVRDKDRYYDLLLRKQAELDNFRKRSARERGEAGVAAAAELLRVLLPVMDNLDRALTTSEGSDNPLRQGIVMIQQQLLDVLKKEGLKALDTKGKHFDPHLHERPSLGRVSSGRDPKTRDGGSGQAA